MVEAALFIEYFGAESSFKSVWDVTGLGPEGCWECGALEFEVDEGKGADKGADKGAVESDHDHFLMDGGHSAGRGMQRISKETGEIMSIKQAFLQDGEQWRKLEDWKDKWYSGDTAERGAKLMAESRWANPDD